MTSQDAVGWGLALAVSCQRGAASDGDSAGSGALDSAATGLQLAASPLVALPFSEVGDAVEDGALAVWDAAGGGSLGGISAEVTGDFSVHGELGPLGAGEVRLLSVAWVGATDAPSLATGSAELTVDGQIVTVDLAAVIATPGLPAADWTTDSWGTRAVVALPSAPFPYGAAPYDDPSVLIFAPAGLSDTGTIGVVTHLHGHNATLEETVAAQYVVEQHALSGRDAILVAPQGPEEAADGDFGRLDEPGGHRDLVLDAVAVLYRDGLVTRPRLGPQVLTSHSGGYAATANIVEQGGLDIAAVHLFDSLYGRSNTYADFARGGGTLRSVYTASGGTDDDNEALRATLEASGVAVGERFTDPALAETQVTIGGTDANHNTCLWYERAYARWLVYSGLARSPLAPVELISVASDGEVATVRWQVDPGAPSAAVRVEGSKDGIFWDTLARTTEAAATVAARPFVRVVSDVADAAPSDAWPGSGPAWLVVDGFDRVLGGSYTGATHDFAARVAAALGESASAASNEAIARGEVALSDYDRVLWLLGDESVGDQTFDEAERAAVAAWLDGGGRLIVSGAELGYATDRTWLRDTLGVTYVSDDAGTDEAGGYRFGVVYPEDYPDVLAADDVIWAYATGGGAAVRAGDRVIAVGFPLETMTDATLAEALPALTAWLD